MAAFAFVLSGLFAIPRWGIVVLAIVVAITLLDVVLSWLNCGMFESTLGFYMRLLLRVSLASQSPLSASKTHADSRPIGRRSRRAVVVRAPHFKIPGPSYEPSRREQARWRDDREFC